MLTPDGTGARGSLPALVMRTGLIRPMSPRNARRDLDTQHILDMTARQTNTAPMDLMPPGAPSPVPSMTMIPALPSATTSAVAATVVATPPMPIPNGPATDMPLAPSDQHHWHRGHRPHAMVREIQKYHPNANIHGAGEPMLGSDADGRPVAKFRIASSPPVVTAESAAHGLRLAARSLVSSGLHALPPQLIGGPLAALMRGGTVELHFQNGVVVRTTP